MWSLTVQYATDACRSWERLSADCNSVFTPEGDHAGNSLMSRMSSSIHGLVDRH